MRAGRRDARPRVPLRAGAWASSPRSAGGAAAAARRRGLRRPRSAQGDLNAPAAAALPGLRLHPARPIGTVTALAAYRAQQTLVNSGLRVTGDATAVSPRPRAPRCDQERRGGGAGELTEALREGEEGGLRKYGIAVQQGATARRPSGDRAAADARGRAQGTDPGCAPPRWLDDVQRFADRDAVTALASRVAGSAVNNVVTNPSTDIRRSRDDRRSLRRCANAERDARARSARLLGTAAEPGSRTNAQDSCTGAGHVDRQLRRRARA